MRAENYVCHNLKKPIYLVYCWLIYCISGTHRATNRNDKNDRNDDTPGVNTKYIYSSHPPAHFINNIIVSKMFVPSKILVRIEQNGMVAPTVNAGKWNPFL